MDLLDTHQHLILRRLGIGYDWADAIPALANRDFTPEDYARLTAGRGLIGAIFMETGANDADHQTEARLVARLIGKGGLLGQVASCRPEIDAGFDDWLDECAGLGVVGFRRILHVVDDDLSRGETFRRNLRKIGARGLPFDLCFLERQLAGPALELLKACPDQTFILDHCGTPDIAGGNLARWKAGMDALAVFPNLFIKLSGLTAYGPPGADLRPYVDHVLERFGPARMLWGGDWPVVDLGAGLPGWIDLTRALLKELSPEERSQIGWKVARRVYQT